MTKCNVNVNYDCVLFKDYLPDLTMNAWCSEHVSVECVCFLVYACVHIYRTLWACQVCFPPRMCGVREVVVSVAGVSPSVQSATLRSTPDLDPALLGGQTLLWPPVSYEPLLGTLEVSGQSRNFVSSTALDPTDNSFWCLRVRNSVCVCMCGQYNPLWNLPQFQQQQQNASVIYDTHLCPELW